MNHIERLRKLAGFDEQELFGHFLTFLTVDEQTPFAKGARWQHARLMKILLPTLDALEKSQAALKSECWLAVDTEDEIDNCDCSPCHTISEIDEMLKGVV